MPLIHVKVVEGAYTASKRREIVERLTDAMVAIEGERARHLTWCVVEEVARGEWGTMADDVRALARADDPA